MSQNNDIDWINNDRMISDGDGMLLAIFLYFFLILGHCVIEKNGPMSYTPIYILTWFFTNKNKPYSSESMTFIIS